MRQAEIEWLLKGGYFSFPGHAVLYQRAAVVACAGFIENLAWYADWFANAC